MLNVAFFCMRNMVVRLLIIFGRVPQILLWCESVCFCITSTYLIDLSNLYIYDMVVGWGWLKLVCVLNNVNVLFTWCFHELDLHIFLFNIFSLLPIQKSYCKLVE